MADCKTCVPDGKAPPRPPSRTWPYRAWSAYACNDWGREGAGAVPLTAPPKRSRIVDREHNDQVPGGAA